MNQWCTITLVAIPFTAAGVGPTQTVAAYSLFQHLLGESAARGCERHEKKKHENQTSLLSDRLVHAHKL